MADAGGGAFGPVTQRRLLGRKGIRILVLSQGFGVVS